MADAEELREEGDAPAAPSKKARKGAKKRASEAKAPLPGAGTPEGETLRKAMRALDAGDYALLRTLLGELDRADDPAIRDAAADLRARIAIDPVQVVVIIACALVLTAIAYVWVF